MRVGKIIDLFENNDDNVSITSSRKGPKLNQFDPQGEINDNSNNGDYGDDDNDKDMREVLGLSAELSISKKKKNVEVYEDDRKLSNVEFNSIRERKVEARQRKLERERLEKERLLMERLQIK